MVNSLTIIQRDYDLALSSECRIRSKNAFFVSGDLMKKASMLATNGVYCTTAVGAILRLCLTLVFGWLVAAVGSADTSTTQPTEYSIVDSGAIGNGVTPNTKDIQEAIDLAAVKGGTVVVPQGVFLTGSIFLKPGVNLHIDQGGVLKGSANIDDYPKMPTRVEGHAVNWIPALVNADSCNGLKISGPGTLDGSGAHFWAEFENQTRPYNDKPVGRAPKAHVSPALR